MIILEMIGAGKMTLNVTIEYPSEKLLPIVEKAIKYLCKEICSIQDIRANNTSRYKNLHFLKKIFSNNPDSPFGENWSHSWNIHYLDEELDDLYGIITSCNSADVVVISSETLARIDYLAEQWNN